METLRMVLQASVYKENVYLTKVFINGYYTGRDINSVTRKDDLDRSRKVVMNAWYSGFTVGRYELLEKLDRETESFKTMFCPKCNGDTRNEPPCTLCKGQNVVIDPMTIEEYKELKNKKEGAKENDNSQG